MAVLAKPAAIYLTQFNPTPVHIQRSAVSLLTARIRSIEGIPIIRSHYQALNSDEMAAAGSHKYNI
jgi:hypothetical protein